MGEVPVSRLLESLGNRRRAPLRRRAELLLQAEITVERRALNDRRNLSGTIHCLLINLQFFDGFSHGVSGRSTLHARRRSNLREN